jgi:hypothetical protein
MKLLKNTKLGQKSGWKLEKIHEKYNKIQQK